jgi:hypothetical protein
MALCWHVVHREGGGSIQSGMANLVLACSRRVVCLWHGRQAMLGACAIRASFFSGSQARSHPRAQSGAAPAYPLPVYGATIWMKDLSP